MTSSNKTIWFAEPFVVDDTWAGYAETTPAWLHRSTLPRAKAARKFLNYNISQLPTTWQNHLYHDLKHRWHSAFFELIVARTLQVLGATLRVEEVTPNGKRPDFHAMFPSGTVIVEAVSPVIDSEIDEYAENSAPLLQIIEQFAPTGSTIFVETLPHLGPADSKRKFKQIVAELLNVPVPQNDEILELSATTSKGPVELSLVARQKGWPVIGGQVGVTIFSNRITRLRRAMHKKRQQVRAGEHPVILAINGNWRCDVRDIDRVLFGSTVQRWNGVVERLQDGEFTKSQSVSPTYAAVLFFKEVGFTCPHEPVLYRHPRYVTGLPAEVGLVTQRILQDQRVIEQPAQQRLLTALNPLDTDVTG